jgi:hypothetical protein
MGGAPHKDMLNELVTEPPLCLHIGCCRSMLAIKGPRNCGVKHLDLCCLLLVVNKGEE